MIWWVGSDNEGRMHALIGSPVSPYWHMYSSEDEVNYHFTLYSSVVDKSGDKFDLEINSFILFLRFFLLSADDE